MLNGNAGSGPSGIDGNASASKARNHGSACRMKGVPSAETLSAIVLNQLPSAVKGSVKSEPSDPGSASCGQSAGRPLSCPCNPKRAESANAGIPPKVEVDPGKQEPQQRLDIGYGDAERSRDCAWIGKIECHLRREFQIGDLLCLSARAELQVDELRVPGGCLPRNP